MARKNQWEQFASAFGTAYDLGNRIQTGRNARQIMDEEVDFVIGLKTES